MDTITVRTPTDPHGKHSNNNFRNATSLIDPDGRLIIVHGSNVAPPHKGVPFAAYQAGEWLSYRTSYPCCPPETDRPEEDPTGPEWDEIESPADDTGQAVGEAREAPRLIEDDLKAKIVNIEWHRPHGTTLTICTLTLANGFTVVGKSACISPENFDADMGRSIAYEDAFRQIWHLEGYLLRERMHQNERCAAQRNPAAWGIARTGPGEVDWQVQN